MQSQLVFQEEKERERLRRQNLLLSQAEKPALEHFFKGKSELSVLDIGCNDGTRTFHRFSDDRISRVIGLEYNQQLVERASAGFQYSIFNSTPWLSGGKRHPRLRSKSKPGLLKADRRKQAEFFF